jgi:hypothetical protein
VPFSVAHFQGAVKVSSFPRSRLFEILKLRQHAKDQLGDKFDIRAFHDEVLDGGALPMDVFKERIEDWIALQKTHSAPSKVK